MIENYLTIIFTLFYILFRGFTESSALDLQYFKSIIIYKKIDFWLIIRYDYLDVFVEIIDKCWYYTLQSRVCIDKIQYIIKVFY